MSLQGTASHVAASGLPIRVQQAVELARDQDFAMSCRLEQGRLLHALAAGATERIGETGTGCGVGLAWMLEARRPGVELVSVDRDAQRSRAVANLFCDEPDLTLIEGDWQAIQEHGPFDLLVLDGGGHGKKEPPIDPATALAPGGVVVIDDFTPINSWPPLHDGRLDSARLWWLEHPRLLATEVRLAPDIATIIATIRPGQL